ncbi:sigma-70 family RNA polymerase sigma factor [Tautonia plasticadhaerens]|uniref:RNA polymerase principal sigma factor HrdB n=1 Tax=Tautonia plasticadhaerens TaxID=2527974 RepID=A0A518GUL7_9BACT|nr:sigma-70 family RNA polymerase sigma factor [Tautonia plasticadhaerens]QDV32271.1 RNA polymerase principal sigma factor HrdB [Tautonia plasticadhaerens]
MSQAYRHPALRQLMDQQARVAARARLLEQLDRAEGLLSEIETEKAYPFEYLCYRITGYRADSSSMLTLPGRDVRHDLRLYVEDLSRTVGQPVEEVEGPVLTVEEVGRRYQVSTRTVNRWRRQGLVARHVKVDGRIKVGFRESSLARFVTEHREQVDRGTRFSQLSDAEREGIIRRARRMAAVRQATPAEIARRIARKMSRSPETIRMTLKTYDRDHPDRAIFPPSAGPLDEEARSQIYRRYRTGTSAEVLAKQYGRTKSSIYRILNELRATRLLEAKLEFMHHPSFDEKAAAPEILAEMPVPADGKAPRKVKAPKGLPPYLASLYEVPLLSREQEAHLFRKMNFLKYRAHLLREKLDPTKAKTAELDEIERLQDDALAVKNQIIRANLRLVVSIAKRHVGPSNNFFELVSDGNMSLIRAVEKFDYSRGNKFSTYASWAIMKNFARTIPEENYRRDRFVTGHEEMFESAADGRIDEHEYEVAHRRNVEAVQGMLGRLDDRERRIMISRYGLDGSREMTLEQLGKELGITKERVRQIESRAQEKLRRIAVEERMDLPMF